MSGEGGERQCRAHVAGTIGRASIATGQLGHCAVRQLGNDRPWRARRARNLCCLIPDLTRCAKNSNGMPHRAPASPGRLRRVTIAGVNGAALQTSHDDAVVDDDCARGSILRCRAYAANERLIEPVARSLSNLQFGQTSPSRFANASSRDANRRPRTRMAR